MSSLSSSFGCHCTILPPLFSLEHYPHPSSREHTFAHRPMMHSTSSRCISPLHAWLRQSLTPTCLTFRITSSPFRLSRLVQNAYIGIRHIPSHLLSLHRLWRPPHHKHHIMPCSSLLTRFTLSFLHLLEFVFVRPTGPPTSLHFFSLLYYLHFASDRILYLLVYSSLLRGRSLTIRFPRSVVSSSKTRPRSRILLDTYRRRSVIFCRRT